MTSSPSSRTFVIGDIHGAYAALMECFGKADFDYSGDRLICLGDACDGWPEVNKVLDELLKVKNLIYIIGNHDLWALKWFQKGEMPYIWISQGGDATLTSYLDEVPEAHIELLQNARDYYIDENKLFVHGGIYIDVPVEEQNREVFVWNRSLVTTAINYYMQGESPRLGIYDEIYVGHTPAFNFGYHKPVKCCNVWLLDTGAGWYGGTLSMINIYNHEIFMSREVHEFYPGYYGRRRGF